MDMSAAALPARFGYSNKSDENHLLFPLYQQYRSNMTRLMVDSSDFRDWLYCYERNKINDNASKRPEYREFIQWMQNNQGGARICPGGCFPNNFYFWIEGGRW